VLKSNREGAKVTIARGYCDIQLSGRPDTFNSIQNCSWRLPFCYNQSEVLLSRSMNIYTTPGAVTITCHKRTMLYLEQEVKELGFDIIETFVTGVKLKATVNECIRLNLNLR